MISGFAGESAAMEIKYDKNNPLSIESFGKRLIGKTLKTVAGARLISGSDLAEVIGSHGRASFGALVEKYYYGIEPDNASGMPDFPEAGVELKTTPVKSMKSGLYSAKERLVLGLINYTEEAKAEFNTSSFFKKNQRLMLISYLHDKGAQVGDLLVKIAKLVDFNKLPAEDQKIIREDWEKIHVKIREGHAHELSEGDTLYLGACTKAADSSFMTSQVGGIPAKPRAYSFKSGYMTELVRRELGEGPKEEEKAVKDAEVSMPMTFEDIVIKKFEIFIGKTVDEISSLLGEGLNDKPKDHLAVLARLMLGVKGKKVAEFEAAEVSMKTLQLKEDGMPQEHMSFPAFKYDDIVDEEWDADEDAGMRRSSFQKQIERRFFFVVYQSDGGIKRLKKVMFWSMPFSDREETKHVWEETKRLVKAGKIDYLPGSTENRVAHVRPHGQDADDTVLVDGVAYGKKSFWLNKSYLKQIVG